jgi:16S rRNA (adenine1518-N6/adenine1519-N6)-dimethyltransferase
VSGQPQGRIEIRELLAAHGLTPRRSLGQHFLADPNLVRKVAALADVGPGDRVVEIGAGTGTLTAALAATGASIVAYEVDPNLAPVLEWAVGAAGVEVRIADAAAIDFVADLPGSHWVLVGNLPYNIGTGIVLDALRVAPNIDRFVVMIQREVADRLLAVPGSKDYGIPSVVVGLHAEARFGFSVPTQVFIPPPEVQSAVVVLRRITAPAEAEAAIRLAGVAFGQRRKMLRRSLAEAIEGVDGVLERAGIDPTGRAEDVAPGGYVAIARALPREEP